MTFQDLTDEVIAGMTAAEYAAAINVASRLQMANESGRIVFELAENADHWAEYGIHTGPELGEYLDACCAQEVIDESRFNGASDEPYQRTMQDVIAEEYDYLSGGADI